MTTRAPRFPRLLTLAWCAASILAVSASAQPASRAVGSWIGTLQIGPAKLRIIFNIAPDSTGAMTATIDSPDQGAMGIPVSSVVHAGDSLTLGVLTIGGSYAGRFGAGDTTITGVWSQGGMSLPLVVSRTSRPPMPARPQTPRPPYPYREEQVTYESLAPGIKLAGTLTLPPGTGRFPAVVVISGSGAQDRDETVFGHKPFLVLADYLTRRGVGVLRVDDRGVGGSTGNTMEATSAQLARDVLAGVRFLRARPEIDPDRIGLIGHSEGGLIAPLAAAESKEIAFIGLLAAPGLPGDQVLLRQTEDVLRAAGASEDEVALARSTNARLYATMKEEKDSAALAQKARAILTDALEAQGPEARKAGEAAIDRQLGMITSPWLRAFVNHDPRPVLRSVACPVLVLHGEKDLQVAPRENQEAILAALKDGANAQVTASILPGLNHLFQTAPTGSLSEYGTIEETMAPAALDAIGGWVTRVAAAR